MRLPRPATPLFSTVSNPVLIFFAVLLAFPYSLRANEKTSDSAKLFDAKIAPLLAQRCFECHDSSTRKGKLDLSSKESALGERKGGKAIIPGHASESLVWKTVESDEMPDDRPPLTPEEKQLLKEWINSGAVWTADTIDPLAYTRDTRAAYNWIARLTVPEYIETVRSAVGVEIAEEAKRILPPDVRADGFQNTAYNLTADLQHIEAFSTLAGIIVSRMDVPKFAARFTKCQELSDDCLRDLIAKMGKSLLRGPLNEPEVDSFLAIAHAVKKEKGNFEEAARYVIEGMLQSPRFIYRIENQHGDGQRRPVEPYELASRLSYMIWGAPPDEELINAAESAQLDSKDGVRAQVSRMMKDPRAVQRSRRFMHEWLDLGRLDALRPDPKKFPTWYDQLAADMREETLSFFEEVVWKEKRPLADLLNAEVTVATPRLANYYGLEAGNSEGRKRVTKGLHALYTFQEGGGGAIRDLSRQGDPLPLKIADLNAVKWTRAGLTVEDSTLISTPAPKAFMQAVRKSKAVTLEAWITPADLKQSGPARILTISSGTSQRNFTLGQDGDKYDVRFRTKNTDANGQPSLGSPGGTVQLRKTHVVYTRDSAGQAKLYIDGKERAARDVNGDISNWNHDFILALGNETSKDRPWRGTFHLVALYSQALSAGEVRQNYDAGAGNEQNPTLAGEALGEDRLKAVQVLYQFAEGKGETVKDSSPTGKALDLKIEDQGKVEWGRNGLTIKDSTLVTQTSSAKGLADAIRKSKAITIEAWITPANTSQNGPARILTFSSGSGERNFTLGQDGDKYEVRFRRKGSDANGLPGLATPAGVVEPRRTHVIFTRDAKGKARLFIDAEEVASADLKGELSDWKDDYKLALGNETTRDRPWRGTLHLVAVYDRALTPEEVRSGGPGQVQRYDLASVPSRGGLLTQGSVLTVGGEEASTVTRGLFILKDFLFSAVGNPPPCADTTPIPAKPGMTRRAIAQTRIDNKACGSCHGKFEPLAFSLEKFDGLGGFHEVDEHGNKLREDGEITFPGEQEPVAYKTTAEFMDLLAKSPRVKKNFTRKITQFAIGRPLVESDKPLVDSIHEQAQKGQGTYESLMMAIATSDLVRMTQTEATQ